MDLTNSCGHWELPQQSTQADFSDPSRSGGSLCSDQLEFLTEFLSALREQKTFPLAGQSLARGAELTVPTAIYLSLVLQMRVCQGCCAALPQELP